MLDALKADDDDARAGDDVYTRAWKVTKMKKTKPPKDISEQEQIEIIISRGRMLLLPDDYIGDGSSRILVYSSMPFNLSLACNLCQTFRDAAFSFLLFSSSSSVFLSNETPTRTSYQLFAL